MSAHASSGNPTVYPQRYHTLPTGIISQAEQQDRWLKQSELKEFSKYFSSGMKLLAIADKLTQNAEAIVSAAADRIFFGGSPMAYLEPPANRKDLPGYEILPRPGYDILPKKVLALAEGTLEVKPASYGNPFRNLIVSLQGQFSEDRDPLPGGFRRINISRYGPVRMKRSMRDLSWFLRYVTYAIIADDSSILTVNVRGLRGVIPEDVTEATVVAMQEMRWRALGYFPDDPEATAIIKQHFDVMIADYRAEKPPIRLRPGVSNDRQGLQLPESYILSAAPRPKFVMKPNQSATETQAVIKAAYRQVFQRDITREYGIALTDLESQLKSGTISTKEFIRRLGKSRLYRREFYEPFVISRVIELAVRHFLGRGVISPEEFKEYFDVISKGGLPALVDALVDSSEYADYFGEDTVPYLRGLGQEAQEMRNWGPQVNLFNYSASAQKTPQFITLFGDTKKPLPNQHPYGLGNDPLEIQFGAIFPLKDEFDEHPALFDRDSRRILIGSGAANGNGANNHLATWGKVPGSQNSRVLKLEPSVHPRGKNGETLAQGVSVSLLKNSPETVIQGIYRQVFGRDLLAGQRLETIELKLRGGEITVREFIRQSAKSRLFRRLYWEPLYVTKAIEYIHRRLLGRPTYGRREMNRYYDICARKGFHALIDELIDSSEYLETFGEDTVPYERYVTPRGFEMRSRPRSGGLGAYIPIPGSLAKGPRVYHGEWVKDATLRGVHVLPQDIRSQLQNGWGKPQNVRQMDGAIQAEPELKGGAQEPPKPQAATEVKQLQTAPGFPSVKQEQELPKSQAATEVKQLQEKIKQLQEEVKQRGG